MVPTKATRLLLGEDLAADGTTFPVASPCKVILFMNDLAIDENTVLADLTKATFDGYADKAAGASPFAVGIDPVTGDQIITINEPAGGWRWETTGVTNLPQTIYGFALANAAVNLIHGAQLLDNPVPLSASGEEVNLGSVTFRLVQQPMS